MQVSPAQGESGEHRSMEGFICPTHSFARCSDPWRHGTHEAPSRGTMGWAGSLLEVCDSPSNTRPVGPSCF